MELEIKLKGLQESANELEDYIEEMKDAEKLAIKRLKFLENAEKNKN